MAALLRQDKLEQSDLEPYRVNREKWDLLQRTVNRTKLRWAINSFGPYKSAGPDLITAGTTVENKGKLILSEIFLSVQKHDIFLVLTS